MSGFGGSVKLTGESAYRKALKQITLDLKEVDSELKVVASQYAKNDKSQEALTAKSEALAKKLETQAKKVETLKANYQALSKSAEENKEKHAALGKELENAVKELERIEKESGKDSAAYKLQAGAVANLTADYNASLKAIDSQEAALSKARIEINNAQTAYNQTGNALSDLNEEIEKTADGANELGDEVKTSGDLAKKAANGGYTVFKNILANLATIAIKQVVSGLKKVGEGLVNTGKEAFNAYAEYEQLVGGVETLFGKSAKTLEKYASEAYKTAGLSANSYMESVTSFSSALIKSLGGDTQKAVEYADKAIKDMSDNANKFGTSIDTIQSVYSALARNTYTTLDNLKLGFAGTKQGAEDLVKEAEKLDKSFKAQRDSSGKLKLAYADMVDAIHIVQKNMKITGATAAEAESTIEGSANAMKAAWQNLLKDIVSDNADISKSVKNLSDSVEKYAKNAIPRIKKLVEGLFKAGKELAKKYMPDVYNTIAPVIKKITDIISGLANFIIKNFSVIAPIILTAAAAFTAFNAAMAISRTITAVSTALGSLSAATSLATKTQVAYNAALASNPIGAVLTAIAALVAAFAILGAKEIEIEKQHREHMEALQALRQEAQSVTDSWNSLVEAQSKTIAQGDQELTHLSSLKDELLRITDANGRIKDGYEERADFIRTQLSEALDIEIEKEGDVIKNIEGISGAIDVLIKKRRAEIILSAQESLVAEAYANVEAATMEAISAHEQYEDEVAKLAEMEKQRDEKLKEYSSAWSHASKEEVIAYEAVANAEIEKQKAVIAESEAYYNERQNQVENYAYNIGVYEKNMELAHQGAYDQMITATYDYYEKYENAVDGQKQALQDQLVAEQKYEETLKQMRAASGDDTYDQMIVDSYRKQKEIERQLRQYEETTGEALEYVELEWRDSLDEQLSQITGKDIKFEQAGNGLVAMYVDGQKQGEDMTEQEAADLVALTLRELSKAETGSEDAGIQVIKGLNSGIGNKAAQSSLFGSVKNLGDKLVSTLKNKLQVASPSKIAKQIGLFFDEGLEQGIKKGEKSTVEQVNEYAGAVTSALQKELDNSNVNLKGLTAGLTEELKSVNPTLAAGGLQSAATVLSSGSTANNKGGFEYQTMVSAFKDALTQVNVELDDQKVGKFVKKTVTQAIYY